MHSFQGSLGTSFAYNSDLSGDVLITGVETTAIRRVKQSVLTIPGYDLLEFVAEFIREQKIEKIEQMTVNELIGIKERR